MQLDKQANVWNQEIIVPFEIDVSATFTKYFQKITPKFTFDQDVVDLNKGHVSGNLTDLVAVSVLANLSDYTTRKISFTNNSITKIPTRKMWKNGEVLEDFDVFSGSKMEYVVGVEV